MVMIHPHALSLNNNNKKLIISFYFKQWCYPIYILITKANEKEKCLLQLVNFNFKKNSVKR